jgi:GNAT superfamily N-acetyltransferase
VPPAPRLPQTPRLGAPGLPPAPAPGPTPGAPVPAPPAPSLGPARPRPTAALEIGRLRYDDLQAVIELVNADLLPGQPTCGGHALEMALSGESPVDSSWWHELTNVQAVVARRGGAVVGAASYATAPADRSGWLLWLHAQENRVVVEALVDHVLGELTGSPHQYAFWIATALSLGLEALPVEQRPVTHEVMQSRGLTGRDSWRYLVLPVDRAPIEGTPEEFGLVLPASGPGEIPAWRLVVGDRERPLAAADIALGADGCGVLWWIDVEPAQRGRGIGRRLLRQAVRFLALRGARTVAAFVDHADPRDRDPRPILRLLGSAGFQDVDRLWSYESPRRRSR